MVELIAHELITKCFRLYLRTLDFCCLGKMTSNFWCSIIKKQNPEPEKNKSLFLFFLNTFAIWQAKFSDDALLISRCVVCRDFFPNKSFLIVGMQQCTLSVQFACIAVTKYGFFWMIFFDFCLTLSGWQNQYSLHIYQLTIHFSDGEYFCQVRNLLRSMSTALLIKSGHAAANDVVVSPWTQDNTGCSVHNEPAVNIQTRTVIC